MKEGGVQSSAAAVRSALRATLCLVYLLGLVVSACAQPAAAQPGATYGRHFIVLIDDSGSIAGRSQIRTGDKRPAIIADLPGQLFGRIKGVPAFNPAQDRVSVLFFTILDSPRACDRRKARSALPENIFDLVYTGKLQGADDFSQKLSRWMSDDCHFNGNWSPIVISSLLVLPYLQSKLPADELHSQTILIQVTDAQFNSQAKPGHELTAYRQSGLDDVAAADQLLSRVSHLFTLNILPNQESLRGVYYLAAEYSSQRPPESAIQYQRNSLLYPQALSPGELRYRLNDQSFGDIQLLSQGPDAEGDFKPLWVRVGFEDAQGGDWRIGDVTLPRLTGETRPVPLSPCERPQCESSKDQDRLGVSLFEAALGGPLKVSASAAEPEPGLIKFSVGFHYDTPIYNHLSVETPELHIKADPAPAAEIPNLFWPASHMTKADIAAEWQRDDDGVTTQEEAKNRSLANRDFRRLLWVILLMFLLVLTMIYLFLRYYHRRFQPRLKWLAAPDVVIDFNRSAGSRLLVGTLQVENDQPVPWLGRLLRNEEQPTREAVISLEHNFFSKSGLELTGARPVGFLRDPRTNAPREELLGETVEAVSDGKQIPVFLAAENIQDYQPDRGVGTEVDSNGHGVRFDIKFKAEMKWNARHAAAGSGSALNRSLGWIRTRVASEQQGRSGAEDTRWQLTVKPEEPRKPVVTYEASAEPRLYFKKGAAVQVGSFWFESSADHDFAQPYRWEGYTVQTYQGDRPLSGEPIRLAQAEVEVPSKQKVEVPVYIYCDGDTIPNPAPASREYSFRLIGDFDSAESLPGPHRTTLYRDPTRADIELRLLQPRRSLEVYWTPEGEARLRTLPDGVAADELLQADGVIELEPRSIRFEPVRAVERVLLNLEIGNTGTAGEGVVEVNVTTGIRCDQAVRNDIEVESDYTLDDLLGVYNQRVPEPRAVVKEGEPVQARTVHLRPGIISRINSARIKSDRLAAEVRLAARVVDDRGAVTLRELTILIPLDLEQLPGLNWLAIDFGTSAISAALGAGPGEDVVMIPLQDIKAPGGRSLALYDSENSERGTPYLPSWICCNWDLRDPSGDKRRPGFPGYYSPHLSMTPGEPDFIGLPAVTHDFEDHGGRIVYSLKSWLGKASRNIPIKVDQNGDEVQKLLPLEKMVESGFAALAEGYLFDRDYHADQIVITYPNTFTRRHQDLLHRIAYNVLGKPTRFGIPLRERVRLISESDAVAYYYCTEQMRGQPRAGAERILVYDFGAGTLDLSLIQVEWKQDPPRYPTRWKVEKRLGVPLAGNYIDEILARLIHGLLSNPRLVDAQGFIYQWPVVGLSPEKERANKIEQRRAIVYLWRWIREAKHEWSRACRDIVEKSGHLADCPPFKVKVGIGRDVGVVRYATGSRPEATAPTDEPGLSVEGMNEIYLSIPARLVEEDERMSQFLDFVTDEVVREVLDGAGLPAADVDTVVVSGRGALFPGLRRRVWRHFPQAATPDLLSSNTMKSAVALGAIARQDLSRVFTDDSDQATLAPRLGVLINYGADLIMEEDWGRPIDLTASPTFRLVQVNVKDPDPRKDMKSLRKHFYIDLLDHEFVRDDVLGDDKHLHIRKEIRNGELSIYLSGTDAGAPVPVFAEDQIAKTVTTPPWPVGNVLLHPQE